MRSWAASGSAFPLLAASLDALSPLAVLGRGYAVARNEQGTILKSWQDVTAGQTVRVTLGEGGFSAGSWSPMGRSKTMSEEKQTFEQKLGRLEQIVAALEKGDAPLADSLALFTEGTTLIAQCSDELDRAEQQVVKLMKGSDGAPVELPFEEET